MLSVLQFHEKILRNNIDLVNNNLEYLYSFLIFAENKGIIYCNSGKLEEIKSGVNLKGFTVVSNGFKLTDTFG